MSLLIIAFLIFYFPHLIPSYNEQLCKYTDDYDYT